MDPLRGTQPGLGRHTCSPVPRPRVKKKKKRLRKQVLSETLGLALQKGAVGMAGGSRAHREVSPMGSQGSCCFKSHNHYEHRKE